MKPVDLTGRRFRRLLVLPQHESRPRCGRQQIFWLCRCDCGTEKYVLGECLRRGTTLSCGCLNREPGRTRRSKGSAKFPGLKSRTPEYIKAANDARWQATKDLPLTEERKRYFREWQKQYRLKEPAKVAALSHRRYQANPGLWTYHALQRRFRLEERTPQWADMKAIYDFYRDCPAGEEVDHIIPLKGWTIEGWPVSGLHVGNNLQYLPTRINRAKKNRMRAEDHAQLLVHVDHD